MICPTFTSKTNIPSQPILYKPHPKWVAAVQRHEEILHHCNAKIEDRYKKIYPQSSAVPSWWHRSYPKPTQSQMEHNRKNFHSLPDRQYRIKVDELGKITLRNRCFFRKCKFKPAPTPIPSAIPGPIAPSNNTPLLHPYPSTSLSNDTGTVIETPKQTTYTSPRLRYSRIPRDLSRLLPHNRSSLKEEYSPNTTRATCRGGERGDVEITPLTSRINNKNKTYRFSRRNLQTKNKMGDSSVPNPLYLQQASVYRHKYTHSLGQQPITVQIMGLATWEKCNAPMSI